MNLEVKHLSTYLPYKLKILNGWGDVKTLNYTYLDDENNGFVVGVKPLLNPLSDLTKKIEVNGKHFIPLVKLYPYIESNILNESYVNSTKEHAIYQIKDNSMYSWMKDLLLEWHFDVFGLIDAGLAVDINTVKF